MRRPRRYLRGRREVPRVVRVERPGLRHVIDNRDRVRAGEAVWVARVVPLRVTRRNFSWTAGLLKNLGNLNDGARCWTRVRVNRHRPHLLHDNPPWRVMPDMATLPIEGAAEKIARNEYCGARVPRSPIDRAIRARPRGPVHDVGIVVGDVDCLRLGRMDDDRLPLLLD